MMWTEDWRSLSRRIAGYLEAVELFTRTFDVASQHHTGSHGECFRPIDEVLLPRAKAINASVNAFLTTFRGILPHEANALATEYASWLNIAGGAQGAASFQHFTAILASLKSEL